MIGPGKYDELCTSARESAQAAAAIVIILGGIRGSGFSCQFDEGRMPALPAAKLAELLRTMADQIENG